MSKRTAFFLFVILVSSLLNAQQKSAGPPTPDAKLPINRVVLYKNGVGYFEHVGRISGSQTVSVDFTTGQLNDVLKSLTVIDTGKGRVTGVNYNSVAPLSQRLNSLRLPLTENTTVSGFLAALRGARIEARNGASVAIGRLLSVEDRERTRGDERSKYQIVSLVTDAGDMRTFEMTPTTSIRIVEHDVNQEVGRYLGLLASARDRDLRRMTISTAGTGDRQLVVSYISEVPIWKSSYRIVLSPLPGQKPLLQGWAIVDNTVGEDWKNVELSLVAGAPVSFIQQLSQPYYGRRPVVGLPQAAMIAPQTHQATLIPTGPDIGGGVIGAQLSGFSVNGMRENENYMTIDGVSANIGVSGSISPDKAKSLPLNGRTMQSLARLDAYATLSKKAESAAQGQDMGDLFEYKLKERISIQKNQSALVPIVQAQVDADRVTVWNAGTGRPLRALWLTNSSDLTLDGGSFNVIDDNAFAGEGLLDPIKPGEKRLLSYAIDQAVRIETKSDQQQQTVSNAKIVRGVITRTTEERDDRTYTVRNEDTMPRTIVIEHSVRPGWKLASGMQTPEETTASFHRFRVKVDPKQTATLTVKERHPLEFRYELSNVSDDLIKLFLSQKSIDSELEQTLRRIIAQKNEIAGFEAHIRSREAEIEKTFNDQERVRENLKALKGSAEERALVQRYTRQLNDGEDRIQTLRREITDLETKRDGARTTLDKMLQTISMKADT